MLAHELAHVKRHDYFVNLLQGAVEVLEVAGAGEALARGGPVDRTSDGTRGAAAAEVC